MSDLPELLFDLVGLISELGGIRKLLNLATATGGADFAARRDAFWRDFVELLQLPEKIAIPAIRELNVSFFAWEHAIDENDAIVISNDAFSFVGQVTASAVDGFFAEAVFAHYAAAFSFGPAIISAM
jgi:hypothetical protein